MPCKLRYKVINEITHVFLTGELTQSIKSNLSNSIEKIITHCPKIIHLDITGIKYIDSAGIGELLVIHSMLYKRDGRLVIVNPSPECKEILNTILRNIIEIKTSESVT
ncbi:STAS domain-containing protein [Endozoicomonas sp. SM1973]|uniref:STAS domain-containing protein n=2 Tax=Spartinivicinus marinus TaxID=2994442 RepID=A0A853IP59_9GAMM|nr:STAS domain-containing protein [Spartinivicinus marinus]